jgi:sterol desaturase/sphingolipid hydroxylase (fatty acid hydroxylase superfamily)
MMWYKTMQEIAGHSGKKLKGSSFIPCIWLPRAFGIELYSQDHELHHKLPAWNFSKRFSLWDKVFGTFYYEQNSLKCK